jgi:RNA polymerase sigma-70 factor (ECF subfamily)
VVETLRTDRPASSPADAAGALETDLVARLRAGDEAACETLVREHGGRLLAVARRYMRSEEDARDAVQEAFIAAFRSIDRFEGGSAISTWLHRIAINCCLMKLRSGRRRPEISIEDLLPTFDETGHRVLHEESWPESVEAALERRQTRERVREAVALLPDKYRTVILLRDIEELSTEETARTLGTTPTAVKVRLHRARQALREILSRDLSSLAARA